MIGEIRQNFTEASASVGLILATALICLQKLQAVFITFLLLNFLEEYIIVKRILTTFTNFLEFVREMCVRKFGFLRDAFTKCVHVRKFLDM